MEFTREPKLLPSKLSMRGYAQCEKYKHKRNIMAENASTTRINYTFLAQRASEAVSETEPVLFVSWKELEASLIYVSISDQLHNFQ